jgi:dTDP-4-amino-4,6-dideoxygalactose transaminase
VNNIQVPFVNLGLQYEKYREEILDKVDEISRQGQYVGGAEVANFEMNLSTVTNCKHVIAVGNGTDALSLILKSKNIGLGDEVITAPNSFIASAGAIADTGATPVFSDVGDDFNLDPDKLLQAISSKTKAILVVHLTGNPAKMDEIKKIAETFGLLVIEDAAQAIGAEYKKKSVGGLGDAAAFSLHPLKNLHLMGDAGFVSTNDTVLYEHLKQRQNHGLMNRNESEFWGQNSRMDAIQAAIGNIKFKDFSSITNRFCSIGAYYHSKLNGVIECPIIDDENKAVYHNFILQSNDRNQLMTHLLESGVETKIHYPIPLHLMQSAKYLEYKAGDFSVAERQSTRILSLPIYPELSDSQVEYAVDRVISSVKKNQGKSC